MRTAQQLANDIEPERRLPHARAMVSSAIFAYWSRKYRGQPAWRLSPAPPEIELQELADKCKWLSKSIGEAASNLRASEASYELGLLYTGLLPTELRTELGAYYTPPSLSERLIDMASEAGVDWKKAQVLDPACGGGAFLAPAATRMVQSSAKRSPKTILNDITERVRGFEVDPFAAWMSHVFLEDALSTLCQAAATRLPVLVEVCDSLEVTHCREEYDLVIGNPPYGRTTLPARLRKKFDRGLYGHANLYGLFTDQALRFTKSGGVIAYVTPTSFLAGEYFKKLRELLVRDAPPIALEFVSARKGVFADVLQETLLATYRKGASRKTAKVFFPMSAGNSKTPTISGAFPLPASGGQPWLVPRIPAHRKITRHVRKMRHRLADFGYKVSTGPLVWNRHKSSLRESGGTGRYPLIWAEAVRADGIFEFRAEKRNHKPYFEPKPGEHWVVTDFPCVLLQRTTAKEQCRRLIAAELPREFLRAHGAVVIENHLNMIRPINGAPAVAPGILTRVLNSKVVDDLFRCINGSVAVSAYELESLPLPSKIDFDRIADLVMAGVPYQVVESAIARVYAQGQA